MIEPAEAEVVDQFLLKMVARTDQPLSFLISSAKTQSARFRLTPRSMLATSRERTRRPCVLRPGWPPRMTFSWMRWKDVQRLRPVSSGRSLDQLLRL